MRIDRGVVVSGLGRRDVEHQDGDEYHCENARSYILCGPTSCGLLVLQTWLE